MLHHLSPRVRFVSKAFGAGFVAAGAVLLGLLVWFLAAGPWYCPRPACSGGTACLVPSCFGWAWIFLIGGPILFALGLFLAYLGRSEREPLAPGPAVPGL